MPEAVIIVACVGALLGPLVGLRLWRRGRRARIAVALLAIPYLLGVWGVLIEPRLLVVRHVAVASPAWTGPPLRIAVLSDTHVGSPHVDAARVARIARRISRLDPDVVVFVGDYVGGEGPGASRPGPVRGEIERGLLALGGARGLLGRAAVLGNHDWWYDGLLVEAGLRRAGVPVLENDALHIRRTGGGFWIAGVADDDSTRVAPSVDAALRAVTTGEPVILLSHRPDIFTQVPTRIALTIAGHTHCGQVSVPFLGRPITPSPGSARWPCGLYDEGGRKLLVSGGIGTSILPVRLGNPPEIVIVTLRGAP